MGTPLLIGLGAGLVSAVLFTSAATGSLLAMALFYLAPMPTFLVGLGWSWQAAAAAALSGGALAGAVMGVKAALAYLAMLGLPVAVLCYLALLSRPVPPRAVMPGQPLPPTVEWYPPGRLVAWATLMAGALAAMSVPMLGTDAASYRAAIQEVVETLVLRHVGPGSEEIEKQNLEALLDVMTYVLPAATAIIWLGVAAFNMWVSAKIVHLSGRGLRPWPDLSDMTYPNGLAIGFVGSLLLTFLPGMLGILATGFAGAFLLAYTLLGLVVLHVVTRPLAMRGLVLTLVYLGILLFGWVAFLVAVVGVGEPIFKLRERALNRPGPPAHRDD